MLDLQPGVHLEEVELAVLEEELDGPGVVVPARLRDLHGGRAHGVADVVGEIGRRALLYQLLVAPLGRAVAFAEPDRAAVLVGEHLHLDVPGPGEVALEVDLGPAEVGLRLAGGGLHRFGCVLGGRHDLHAAAPAAEGRLDGDRPPVQLAEGDDLVG